MAGLLSSEKYSAYYRNLSLIYQKPEIKASIEVMLSVFMVTALIFVAIKPTLTNIAGLQKKITDQETMSLKADKKIAQLLAAQTQLDDFKDKLPLFEKAVADNFSYYEMLARIEWLARKYGVNIETVSAPGRQVIGKEIKSGDRTSKLVVKGSDESLMAELNLTLSGKPKNIRGFLQEIENMDVLTMISSITFAKEAAKSNSEPRLKVSLPIQFYFLPLPDET